jgi:cytochrome o ubiquinol oxidase subunit 2
MSPPKNKKLRRAVASLLLFSPLLLLSGCALQQVPVLHTDGPIAATERDLLLGAAALMLIVVIPVFVMAAWFAWHYRASNTSARYMPDWGFSAKIEAAVWLVPTAIVAALAAMVWIYTGRLDPYETLAVKGETPLQVEAISLDWKWVFIYPKQHIATVNELVVPTGRPVSFKLTSDTVMDSFYIPGLVGQIYTMAGMRTRLNMVADAPGRFTGLNTMYSGTGFSDQHFAVRAVRPARFAAWIKKVKQAPKTLDAAAYARLERPSAKVPVTLYSAVEPHLFGKVIAKYAGPPARKGRKQLAKASRRNA